tara:strand:- start:4920 stop:5480 length:561 start_codon:yes stop_codon:yes gene_type:complete
MFQRTIFPSIIVLIIYGLFIAAGIFYFQLDTFATYSMLNLLDIDMLFDSDLAYDATIDFIRFGLTPAIIFINIITAISLIVWFVFGEFIGINRPGQAKKFIFVWLGIYLTQLLIFFILYYYFLHFIPDADDYLKTSASAFLQLSLIIINFLIFFILSIFLSSRVIKTALPMSILVSLFYRLRKKSR